MKLIYKTFYILTFFCFLVSCKKPGCFEKGGSVISTNHSLPHFDTIILNDNISLALTQSNSEEIKITAPERIQPNITLTVEGTTLIISNNTSCDWLRNPDEKISAELSFVDLKKIDYRGSGNITNTGTISLDALQIESETGAGNIELTVNNRYTGTYIYHENAEVILHGNSESVYSYTNARGKINFADLYIKKMVIEYGSLADTHINVNEELDAIIYHKGNLVLKGNPLILRSETHSSGRLIRE